MNCEIIRTGKLNTTSAWTQYITDSLQQFSSTPVEQELFQEAYHSFQHDQYEDAEKYFIQLIALSPNNYLYGEFLGAIWFQTKQYQKALELFSHLATHTPNQTRALQWCAECLVKLNRLEDAQACQKLTSTVQE